MPAFLPRPIAHTPASVKTHIPVNRRTVLSSTCLLATLPLTASANAQSSLRVSDLTGFGAKAPARRARLLVPSDPAARRRILILLHGRGETVSERLGLRAWPELYGLVETDARLRAGKATPTLEPDEVAYTPPQRLQELEAELSRTPYRGMGFVCPVTPNPAAQPSRGRFLRRYGEWLTGELLEAVRGAVPEAEFFALDGCSMGGPIALETFIEHPDVFTQVGMIQGALGAFRAKGYADRLKQALDRVGSRPIHLVTSTSDAFIEGNTALHKELESRKVRSTLEVPRGPHNQPFLRQIGTWLVLRWHDRHFPR